MKGLRQRILAGETVLGCWLSLGNALTAEIVGQAGFDWALIDLEHGAGDEQMALAVIQTLAGTPCAAVVRVESEDPRRVHRILDMGAEGIMFPQLKSTEEAKAAIAAMRYQPEGLRGVARNIRAAGFGQQWDVYYASYKQQQIGIVQIENLPAMEHLDAMAAMDGVDVLFVGPMDLTMALGVFRQVTHAKYQEAIRRVAEAAKRAGKACGVLMGVPEEFKMYHDLGYTFIACNSEGGLLAAAAKATAGAMRKMM